MIFLHPSDTCSFFPSFYLFFSYLSINLSIYHPVKIYFAFLFWPFWDISNLPTFVMYSSQFITRDPDWTTVTVQICQSTFDFLNLKTRLTVHFSGHTNEVDYISGFYVRRWCWRSMRRWRGASRRRRSSSWTRRVRESWTGSVLPPDPGTLMVRLDTHEHTHTHVGFLLEPTWQL